MIQYYMLSLLTNQVHNKTKRLVNKGIRQDNVLFDRVMESVNKPQVQALICASGLEPLVVEGYIREIITEELSKPIKKSLWSVIFGKTKQRTSSSSY